MHPQNGSKQGLQDVLRVSYKTLLKAEAPYSEPQNGSKQGLPDVLSHIRNPQNGSKQGLLYVLRVSYKTPPEGGNPVL